MLSEAGFERFKEVRKEYRKTKYIYKNSINANLISFFRDIIKCYLRTQRSKAGSRQNECSFELVLIRRT